MNSIVNNVLNNDWCGGFHIKLKHEGLWKLCESMRGCDSLVGLDWNGGEREKE